VKDVKDVFWGEQVISTWYTIAQRPQTPPRANGPPEGSASPEDRSGPYKGGSVDVAPLMMELRSSNAALRRLEDLSGRQRQDTNARTTDGKGDSN